METKILEKIGLTGGEIKVYMALLRLGNTTSGPIISRSKAARSKVYEILDKLKEKGLVTESIMNKTRYFQAVSPERIIDYIKARQKELKDEEDEFKKILPELVSQQKFVEDRQEAKVYVGFEGVKTFFSEVFDQLAKGDEYCEIIFSDKSLEYKSIILLFRSFQNRLAEKGIAQKILCNDEDVLTQKTLNFPGIPSCQFRVIEQDIPAGIAVFKDSVATFSWSRMPRVFVIICRENAEQYKKFFSALWEKARNP